MQVDVLDLTEMRSGTHEVPQSSRTVARWAAAAILAVSLAFLLLQEQFEPVPVVLAIVAVGVLIVSLGKKRAGDSAIIVL